VITGVHTIIYATDPEAARAFFRDVLEWPNVDAHGGWLIFKTGPSELAAHPLSDETGFESQVHHEVSLMCDDIEATIAELKSRGAEFTRPVRDDRWGLTTSMVVPGAGTVLLYEPRHPTAADL
jgi:predicted enzyme related to lactoylglutathione lyase